jgi:hypothetical protein
MQILISFYVMGLIVAWMEAQVHELTCRAYESRTTRQKFLRIFSWPTYFIRGVWDYLKWVYKDIK